VQKDRQTATVAVAANENESTPSVIALAKSVKGDNAGQPDETAAALLMEPSSLPDRNEVTKPSIAASETNSGDAQDIADQKIAPGPVSNDANFYRERGFSAYRGGDFLGAIGNFDKAIRLNPDDAQSYNLRGNVWDELGIFERALADY